ncbi:restriction endonuclease subunit S [Thalassospira sp. TSL5-1]|uniref:restriction endonuclease subunit S n=1 Tax=Thalassospira sp. TSL5-1 TaxID=1544451 RepID=UPI000939C3F2|nr:restriction endonuclease subunit S [Thalassospira sp. TSL5-1]
MTHEVPEGWETSSFGSRCRVQSGYAFKSADFVDEGANTVPVIRMSNLKSGTITLEDSKYVDVAKVWGLENFRLSQGDFLFGMSGSIGNYGVVTKQADGSYLNQRVGRLMVQDGFPQFFQYLYLSQGFQNILKGKAAGNAQVNISSKDIQAIEVTIPSLPEQKKIAEVLCSVDEAIAATKAVIDQTKQVKKGLLQTLLTKGIGHTKFKQTELGEIPESWEVKKLSEIARVIDCKHRTPKYYDEGFPIVRPRDVKEGPLELSNCIKTSKEEYLDLIEPHKPEQGDIVFSRNATFGIGAIVESEQTFAIGQDVCIIHGQTLSGSLLFYIINSPVVQNQLKKLSSGSTFKRINLKDIRNLLLPEVPPKEQDYIVKRLRAIDNFSMAEMSKLKQLEIVKSGLMSDLLSGSKRVELPDA